MKKTNGNEARPQRGARVNLWPDCKATIWPSGEGWFCRFGDARFPQVGKLGHFTTREAAFEHARVVLERALCGEVQWTESCCRTRWRSFATQDPLGFIQGLVRRFAWPGLFGWRDLGQVWVGKTGAFGGLT